MSSETEVGASSGAITILNETEVSDTEIMDALRSQHPEVAALERWSSQGQRKSGSVFKRDQYVNSDKLFEKMRIAAKAVKEDDIVSGVAETTEQLAFKRIALEVDDQNEESVWQQMVDRLDLATFMRKVWRELFTVSQAYMAVVYGQKNFKVRGRNVNGNRRKKTFSGLEVPIGLTILDPTKIVPVGSFMFGQERLAYIADTYQMGGFNQALLGNDDEVVRQLLVGRYEASEGELAELQRITGENLRNRLYLLNPDQVWRITATRPDYERFADIRLESVFELLDLKHLLREMDRQALVGSTNAIILVKKGSDQLPAKSGEIQALASQVSNSSRAPIIVGDHRIDVEIITPKTDKTLAAERYNGIDSRITSRLYQILSTGNYASGTATDDSIKLLRVVASSMEARRDIIRDSLMENVFLPTWERNDTLIDEPSMQFYPRRIALDFDQNIATFIQDLRDRGDISRETILAELDILEEDEAVKRQREAEMYDEIFTPTTVPYSANPDNQENTTERQDPDTKTAGRRRGGIKNGGGATNRSEPNR